MQATAETCSPFSPFAGNAMAIGDDTEWKPDICWQAMRSRDPRFDGRFYVAAVTTGIYCRPICPVPFAKPNNIALFPCAAAAEAAGFRPCRRCRPETAPGTPAWAGTSAVVSRALRLIWEGALDTGNVEELAERLGVGSRQLRRLFKQHLGVAPIKIAITHRLHFARTLIEQTDMAMTDIALNAGFNSIRQFNHAVLTTAGQAPTKLRRLGSNLATSSREELVLRLPYRPPLDWAALMAFLGSRATPGVEVVKKDVYQRTIESDGEAGVIDVKPAQNDDCLIVRITLPKYGGLLRIVERVRRLFDLRADPLQISVHLSRDQRLRRLLERRPGLRVPGAWDGFEIGVRAVLGQGLAATDSSEVAADLVKKFGRKIHTSVNGLTHLFPRPEDLIEADFSRFGVARNSGATIRALAHALCDKTLTFESSRGLQDTISRLRAIEGFCEETAHYIASRAFGEPDAFPLNEPALVRAVGASRRLKPSESKLSMAEAWRPWRSYAAMHLWAASADIFEESGRAGICRGAPTPG